MIGIHRRKRIEGWALDVSEHEGSRPQLSLKQRLADDNRLWLLTAGAIVVMTFWMIMDLQNKQNFAVKQKPSVVSSKVLHNKP